MTGSATRYLFLTRHGEASPDENGLTENGNRQAVSLGHRLKGIPFSAVYHGPLARTARTAHLIGEQLAGVPVRATELAGDYVPHMPGRDELPPESADVLLGFLDQFPTRERTQGPALAHEALRRFTGPVEGNESRYELVVTHNFLIGWLVTAAQDAPRWRWLSLNHGNAALTVIRYAPGRPSSVLVYNDMGHLPVELRWTGFPAELRV